MKLDVLKIDGTKSSAITLDDSVFGIEPNHHVVHQAVVSELSNSRQGTHSSKNRSMVRGGGKKPWKQKGRGVARAGTNRSPIWKGGGVVFGPEPHKYSKKTTKKMRRLARKSVLSDRVQNGKFIVIDDISLDEPKTKLLVNLLSSLKLTNSKITLLVDSEKNNLFLAARNIPNVYLVESLRASTYDLIDCDVIVAEKSGAELLNNQLNAKQ
ncbi:MAG: 50S ribosomal protein L4 [Candidatus Neomarinimicrobiota bacterium]|jgi:large subunit ribosomal protein L4|nr:50S ribosomal protein L4 [Candidatus Neomarinimicrobiota bacterium]|tara:strand:+ start:1489 stop:2121 length:633 start_codon:yes stop_codon:yes gene_type:complete